jgi:16S rRNA (uracil1498-N3)-methyltransferase
MDELRNDRKARTWDEVFLLFGPEGGFTDTEMAHAEARGVRKVFLGDSVLRLETAFIGVLSTLRLMLS